MKKQCVFAEQNNFLDILRRFGSSYIVHSGFEEIFEWYEKEYTAELDLRYPSDEERVREDYAIHAIDEYLCNCYSASISEYDILSRVADTYIKENNIIGIADIISLGDYNENYTVTIYSILLENKEEAVEIIRRSFSELQEFAEVFVEGAIKHEKE